MGICYQCQEENEKLTALVHGGITYNLCPPCYPMFDGPEQAAEGPKPEDLAGKILPTKPPGDMLLEALQALFKQYGVVQFVVTFPRIYDENNPQTQHPSTSFVKIGDAVWIDGALRQVMRTNDFHLEQAARKVLGMVR